MSKWIRGRLMRPITSIVCTLMLVSFLLPLAPPPVQAQSTTLTDAAKLFGASVSAKPTPIVAVDFVNTSDYKTGMLGRTFTDALTIELLNVNGGKTFDVIKRSEMEQAMAEQGFTPPLDYAAQSMIADRLGCKFTVSGKITNVRVGTGNDGTFAEVSVEALVISKITKLPINGARVTQRSSPKLNFTGNKDVLVQEALSTAAYQVCQRLMDNRLPIATVLTSPRDGDVLLKGGSTIGLHTGMTLLTIRRESVTGRLTLTSVTPNDSYGEIQKDSFAMIAPGDKAVPVFEFKTSAGITREVRDKAGKNIAMYLVAGLLFAMMAGGGGGDGGGDGVTMSSAPVVTSVSDPWNTGVQTRGKNIIRWSGMGSNVLAYLIYRDSDPNNPIDIVFAGETKYVDTREVFYGNNIAETIDVQLNIDTSSGQVTDRVRTPSPIESIDGDEAEIPTVADTDLTATLLHVPLAGGQKCSYFIRTVYKKYRPKDLDDPDIGHPTEYMLDMSAPSPYSARVTLINPPDQTTMEPSSTEGTVPSDGNFRCAALPQTIAYLYTMQFSNQSTFPASRTLSVSAQIQGSTVIGTATQSTLNSSFPSTEDQTIYWRVGAKVQGDPAPSALDNSTNTAGWVFSHTNTLTLPGGPPSQPLTKSGSVKQGGNTSTDNPTVRNNGSQTSSPRRHRLFRR
ncbi:MAG: hypothetical protein ACYDBB_06105 [Armatimonadota bacterium]